MTNFQLRRYRLVNADTYEKIDRRLVAFAEHEYVFGGEDLAYFKHGLAQ